MAMFKTVQQRLLTGGVISLLIILLAAVFYSNLGRSPVPLVITIAEAHQPAFALLYIAQEKGFFNDQALQVKYHRFTSGRDALDDVVAGNADLATVFETPVVLQALAGVDLRILSTLHQSSNNTGLLALRASGIEKAADLIGKRIGVPFNTNAQFFLSLYLQSQGISSQDIHLVDTAPEDLPKQLLAGNLDAVAIWNPYLHSIKAQFKKEALIHFRSDVYTEMSVLAARENTLFNKKVAIQRLYHALARAEKFLQNHPQQALALVLKQFRQDQHQSIREVWPGIKATLALDNLLLNVLRGEAQWFYQQGVVKDLRLDFENIFYSQFLSEVNVYGVTVN